jgi:hypothetical protein
MFLFALGRQIIHSFIGFTAFVFFEHVRSTLARTAAFLRQPMFQCQERGGANPGKKAPPLAALAL